MRNIYIYIYTGSPSGALSLPFFGEGSPTKIGYSKKGTLILTSLLEDLVYIYIYVCRVAFLE